MKNKARQFALSLAAFMLLPISLAIATQPQPIYGAPAVDAKIEIVWPHDEQGRETIVGRAPFVNVEAYLFERGTLNPVSCSFPNRVVLRWANSNKGHGAPYMAPAHDYPDEPHSAIGQPIMREIDGKTFSAWVFNNIPTGYISGQPLSGYPVSYFFLDVEGADMRTNVWAHHYDPRPLNPAPGFVTNVGGITPSAVDALIQIVWPHDEAGRPQPETNARLANIGVDLAEHPSSLTTLYTSLGFDFNRQVRLLRSLNNGFLEFVKTADQIAPHTGLNNLSWPRWEFDNVDVSAALNHNNTYYFAVQVDGVPTHTTIWVYGTDARTYFPHTDIPARSCQD